MIHIAWLAASCAFSPVYEHADQFNPHDGTMPTASLAPNPVQTYFCFEFCWEILSVLLCLLCFHNTWILRVANGMSGTYFEVSQWRSTPGLMGYTLWLERIRILKLLLICVCHMLSMTLGGISCSVVVGGRVTEIVPESAKMCWFYTVLGIWEGLQPQSFPTLGQTAEEDSTPAD